MYWQYHPYILPCLITASVAWLLARTAWQRRNAPGALPLSLFMLAVTVWSLAYAVGLGSTSLAAKVFWAQVQYFGIAPIAVLWLVFAMQYAGQGKWLTRRNLALLSIIPLVTILLVWSNAFHSLVWSETHLELRGDLRTLALSYGSWFWVQTAYAYVLISAGVVFLVAEFRRRPWLHRGQWPSLLLGVIFPLAGNLMRIAGLSPVPDLDLTPFAFTLSGLFFTFGLLRFRLFDIIPVARSALLESMSEGVIAVDQQNRVVDINPAAERFLQCSAEDVVGKEVGLLFPDAGLLEHYLKNGVGEPLEIALQDSFANRVYDVRGAELKDSGGQARGHLIVLRDITERKQIEENLRDSEERFRQLAEASFEAVGISADGIVLDINPQFLEMYGYQQPGEVIGQGVEAFVAPEYLDEVKHNIATNYQETYRSVALRKDASRFPVELRGKMMRYQGRTVRVTSIRNISDRLKDEDTMRRRAEELTTLYNLSLEISAPHDVSTLLEKIVAKAVQLLGGGGGGLYLCDPQRSEVRCVVSFQTPHDYRGTVLKYGEGAAGIVAETGKPLIIPDYRTWEGRARVYENESPFRSVISTPLVWRDEVIGVIHVLRYEDGLPFTQEHLELLSLFANQAAIAIENADFVNKVQTYARRMALLNDLTHVAISAPNLDTMLQRMVDRLGELFDADGAYITLWDEDNQMPIPSAAFGKGSDAYTSITTEPGEPTMTVAVLESGRVLAVEDVTVTSYVSPRIASLFTTRAVMGLPLVADGRKLGAAFISYDKPHPFGQDEITLGEQAGAQVALAIAKAQFLEAEQHRSEELTAMNTIIQQLAITDELTGLYNRRGIWEFGKREVDRAIRFNRPLSAIMLDIDRFKLVNDRYGHPMGDIVLRQLADCCRGNVRTIDILGRYGGEEFIILLPETRLEHAVQVAERVRHHLGEMDIETPRGDIRITVSAGVTEFTPEVQSLEALFAKADQELYKAKHLGRNQVAYSR
jgi:diguanylate cyclase (GGDEF)-like protein/PAS domain S-box-containing protein